MKYFVTGATGFIGGDLARQLVKAGHEVVVLARTLSRAKDLADLGITVHQGDIVDKESMRAPMTGVDGVYHIAAWYKVGARDKAEAERINVGGTRNVLELMKELSIPKGVYTSTLAINSDTHGRVVDETYRYDGPHLSEYDRTKWAAHYEVALPMIQQGLPLVIVQPGLVYGPGDTSALHTTLVDYLRRRLLVAPQKTAYCWGYVEDTARGHILAMDKGKPGESYIIAGPVHTLIDALKIAEQITGVPGPRLHPSPGLLKLAAALSGVVGAVVPLPELYTAEMLRVSAGVTYLGTSEKAKRELGFKVRPLEEGLRETLLHEKRLLGMELGEQARVS
jgi:nucleoside-diphosphate-sugar epimerase